VDISKLAELPELTNTPSVLPNNLENFLSNSLPLAPKINHSSNKVSTPFLNSCESKYGPEY
jgi:hypothetical protein